MGGGGVGEDILQNKYDVQNIDVKKETFSGLD